MKPVFKVLGSVEVSDRQAFVLFVVTVAAFVLLVAAMLSVTTNTAMANRELDRLNARDKDLQKQITDLWTDIGNVTSADRMDARAKQMGFGPTTKVEHLVVTAGITATLPAGRTR